MHGWAYPRLIAQPNPFCSAAAIRVLTRAAKKSDLADHARFRTEPGLAYPPADIIAIAPSAEGRPLEVTTAVMGLTGTSGVLPRAYTELVTRTLRSRSAALQAFL